MERQPWTALVNVAVLLYLMIVEYVAVRMHVLTVLVHQMVLPCLMSVVSVMVQVQTKDLTVMEIHF